MLSVEIDLKYIRIDMDAEWPTNIEQLVECYLQFGILESSFHAGLLVFGFGFYVRIW